MSGNGWELGLSLRPSLTRREPRHVSTRMVRTLTHIASMVAERLEVPVDAVLQPPAVPVRCEWETRMLAHRIACFLALTHTSADRTSVGEVYGNRSAQMVRNQSKGLSAWMRDDLTLSRLIRSLQEELRNERIAARAERSKRHSDLANPERDTAGMLEGLL